MTDLLSRWAEALRRQRRALKASLPYVRRREHRIAQRKYAALIDAFSLHPRRATDARLHALKPLQGRLEGDVCYFVSFAAKPPLKPHVLVHLDHLLRAGFKTVLVINTPCAPEAFAIDPALMGRLSAVFVRENVGFDFAAWAHMHAACGGLAPESRLLLVNDSIVGPLSEAAFTSLIARLRRSSADLVGLTENASPLRHLQSYFLAFGPQALASPAFRELFQGMQALPTKDLVIDVYETTLTKRLTDAGLKAEALFPALYDDPLSANDTTLRWEALILAGFPYLKASVLAEQRGNPRVRALVPAALLPPAP